jgi:hypothetical protein
MIFVSEEKKGKIVPFPFLSEDERVLGDNLKLDLEKIHMMIGQYRFTEDFLDLWVDWYTSQEGHPPFNDEKLSGYIERRPTHAMKLSLIMSASSGNSMILRATDLERSIKLLEATEVKMPTTFSGIGRSPIAIILPRIMAYIATKREVTLAELLQVFSSDVDSFILETRVLRTLEASNYIKVVHTNLGKVVTYTGMVKETTNEEHN